jgi:uncharacterized protein YggE
MAILFILMASIAAPALAQQVQPPDPPMIMTRGQASVKRAPDQAWVTIAAESRAATPAEAQRLTEDAMKALDAALSRAGLPEAAIRTTGYSLHPDMEYTNGRSRVRGYIARNQVEARVDDLKKLGAVLGAAGASGATSIAGLRFDLKDRANVEREALRLAVQDAMSRARAIASGAGATLGSILRIEEQGAMEIPVLRTASAGADSSGEGAVQIRFVSVSPGELEIRGQVTLTVAIR